MVAEEGLRSIVVADSGKIVVRQTYSARPTCVTLEVNMLPRGVYAEKVETTKSLTTKKLLLE